MWVFGGGPPERFSCFYQYQPNRKYQVAIDFFSKFKGYLHCDGYQAYDNLCDVNKDVKQAGCWYHSRRKFKDASKVSKKPGGADWFIERIKELAKIEKTITDNKFNPEQTRAYRLEHVPKIIKAIKKKLDALQNIVPPQGLLGKAVHYTLNQWPKLQV